LTCGHSIAEATTRASTVALVAVPVCRPPLEVDRLRTVVRAEKRNLRSRDDGLIGSHSSFLTGASLDRYRQRGRRSSERPGCRTVDSGSQGSFWPPSWCKVVPNVGEARGSQWGEPRRIDEQPGPRLGRPIGLRQAIMTRSISFQCPRKGSGASAACRGRTRTCGCEVIWR
jgi:hypothetical protein